MTTITEAPANQPLPAGRPFWLQGTILAALAATTLEALLLQQKKSFFTGGFLNATHAAGVPEALGFLVVSVVVDASMVGLVAALLVCLTAPLRLTRATRAFLVATGSLAPLVIWDFITYQLLSYLGDAFDLGLMFDLVGRQPQEIFAVASSHIVGPIALTSATAAALGGIAWTLNRFAAGSRTRVRISGPLVAGAVGLFLAGVLTAAVASAASETLEDGLRRKPSGNLYARLTDVLTDFDRDGFGIAGKTRDPSAFNGAIYPYALEVPGNGIDEDGVGGDLPSAEPFYREVPPASSAWRQRPDIVLFVLESFRADAVGRIVNGQSVTPALDALARDGVSSQHAFSHNGYTSQSRYHLFTGSLAGLRRDGSLVDDFKRNGYETAYFSGQDESFGGPEFAVGFERADVAYDARQDRDRRYSTFSTAGSLAVSHKTLRERIDAFLAARDRSKPLFLYVNFHDTHFPYTHSDIEPVVSRTVLRQKQIAPSRRDDAREMYLNTAANVDRALGFTLQSVARAVGRAPAVIVTADHGESLFDEGFLGHGYALNDVQTRIPLIVRGLPMSIGQPFGQSELRDAIHSTLSLDSFNGVGPRVFADPTKVVFQYLGNIHRPRQIAFTSSAGRLVWDFREIRVLLPDGRRARPGELTGETADQFRRLVRFWERMMLARSHPDI